MISMSARGGRVVIKKSKFFRNFTGDCQSILIEESEFLEFNHQKIQRLKSNHKIMEFEGMVIALENFRGPISVKSSKFS
jgi:hypothetical protein